MSSKLGILLVVALSFVSSQVLWAQRGGQRPQGNGIKILGQITEPSGTPIEFATIMLRDTENKKPLKGTTSDQNGAFQLKSPTKNIQIEISFIGFATKTITDFNIKNGKIDLGTIVLGENSELLDEVVVQAERSTTEFKLDKRVFNVGQDLSSTGASALELLNNVPSVEVSIEGRISLRGSSGVQILINGKPSVLASSEGKALGSITADMIDRVEVITNPSAKYEAEGTSGIINIVLKKEERKGLNGSLSLNTGLPQNHSVGLSVNRRSEKFNLFSQLGVGYRELPNTNSNINKNYRSGESILSEGENYRNENFYNVVLGADYHIDKSSVLTLSGNFAYEIEDQPSTTDFTRQINGQEVAKWARSEETEATNPKWQYELQYKKDFKGHEDHDLLFSAQGRFFGKDQSSLFTNAGSFGDLANYNQKTATDFGEAKYTYNLDYTKPFSEQIKLEIGSQYVLQDVNNAYEVSELIDDNWVANNGLTNEFGYKQNVLGAYATGAYEGDKWGLKLGLRVENTDLSTELITTKETNAQNYTDLFPSVHTSYKFSEHVSVQAGYSRRIFRPRLWDLNPFFNIRNNFSISTGNPDLGPQYSDSYELNSIYVFDKVSFNLGTYLRNTTDVVERVTTFSENVRTTMPVNLGQNRTTGVEFNMKYSPSRKLSFSGDFNLNHFNRQGNLEGRSFDFSAQRWSSRLSAKIKLPASFDVELSGNYRSAYKNVQGTSAANLFANMGMRKKIMGGKAVISFSVRDIFASRVREFEIDDPNYYVFSTGQRGRFMTLGFSYGFGKGEAMVYSGGRRR